MTNSVLKILGCLVLLLGGIAGLGIYHTGIAFDQATQRDPNALTAHDCPVYPVPQASFLANGAGNDLDPWPNEETLGAGCSGTSFIDIEICRRKPAGVQPAALASDGEFVRRIYVDLTGRIPSADQAKAFLDDSRPNKRALLIDNLLNSPEFVERMAYFYGELLRNTSRRLYGPGRNQFFRYIKQSVQDMVRESNPKPYTEFVQEMILAKGDTASEGPVNFLARAWIPGSSQADFRDDIGIQVGKAFLGTTFECISCHSGARHLEEINLGLVSKKRDDLWGMSAFFGSLTWINVQQGVTYRVDDGGSAGYRTLDGGGYRPPRNPSRQFPEYIQPKFILNDARVDFESNYREEFVKLLFADPQFAKAAVNYLWAELMGRGIVDPPNGFDLARQDPLNPPPAPWQVQPSHPELLAQLADEFRSSGYSVRHMVKLIVSSDAYRRSGRYSGQWRDDYNKYFVRRNIRRFTAEQMLDAITMSTGVLPTPPMFNTGMGYSVNFAVQVQEPSIVGGGADNIMNIFEAGNRDDTDRLNRGSMRQSIYLMNPGNFVGSRLRASSNNGNLVRRLTTGLPTDPADDPDPDATNNNIVESLYLSTLSRYPTADERAKAIARLSADLSRAARTKATEDLAWTLLNKLENIFY